MARDTTSERLARLEQSQVDSGKRLDDIYLQITNHIPHQIADLGAKMDKYHDRSQGVEKSLIALIQGVERNIPKQIQENSASPWVQNFVYGVIAFICLSFGTTLVYFIGWHQ